MLFLCFYFYPAGCIVIELIISREIHEYVLIICVTSIYKCRFISIKQRNKCDNSIFNSYEIV